jgi:transcription elongation factor Elf1
MDQPIECPFCGEPGEVEADIDESEPGEHVFVQDCGVCCRPWAVRITVGADGEVTVDVDRS